MSDKLKIDDEIYEKALYAILLTINSDLTEGRGHEVVLGLTESQTVANNIGKCKNVQGSDASQRIVPIFRIGSLYYGPVELIKPTKEQLKNDLKLERKQIALDKIRAAGITEEDIKDALL